MAAACATSLPETSRMACSCFQPQPFIIRRYGSSEVRRRRGRMCTPRPIPSCRILFASPHPCPVNLFSPPAPATKPTSSPSTAPTPRCWPTPWPSTPAPRFPCASRSPRSAPSAPSSSSTRFIFNTATAPSPTWLTSPLPSSGSAAGRHCAGRRAALGRAGAVDALPELPQIGLVFS
jgi:hypothetical protein